MILTVLTEGKQKNGPIGLFDDHHTFHDLPMAGESAHEGVGAWFLRDGEIGGMLSLWLDDVAEGDDIGFIIRNVVFFKRVWVVKHFERVGSYFFVGTGVNDNDVVRHGVLVIEDEGQRLSGFGFEFGDVILQSRHGLDDDFSSVGVDFTGNCIRGFSHLMVSF